MARPIVPDRKKKRAVSLSLSPPDLLILDNLCSINKKHRSSMVVELIQTAGWSELGLAAIDEHIMPVRSPTYNMACNPIGKGHCTHPMCEAIYKRLENE